MMNPLVLLQHTISGSILLKNKRGQVVAEYVMILTIVVMSLIITRVKIGPLGGYDICQETSDTPCEVEYKTIMERLSDSFTIWMQDIFVVLSLPT